MFSKIFHNNNTNSNNSTNSSSSNNNKHCCVSIEKKCSLLNTRISQNTQYLIQQRDYKRFVFSIIILLSILFLCVYVYKG